MSFVPILLLSLAAHAQTQPAKTPAGAAPQVPVSADVPDLITSKATNSDPILSIEGAIKMRDPFQRPKIKLVDGGESGHTPPLQRYSVEEMKLVGVIAGTKKNKAMLVAPDSKMYIVAEDTKIGTRKGYVKMIGKDVVVVEEKVINILGREEKSEFSIEFKDAKKGM